MLEIDRQNPFEGEVSFGKERVKKGAMTIDLTEARIIVADGDDGSRQFILQSSDGEVTVTLRGLTTNSVLEQTPQTPQEQLQ